MSRLEMGRYRLVAGEEARPGVPLRAEDTLLERRVELLLLPPAAAAEPARLERIRREVERAAGFVHPNVATVYGLEEGDGWQFVTLEPPAGQGLGDRLAAGELPPASALGIAATLCEVLAAAKEAGVVHGALGPGDVALHEDGTVAVGGFGLHELRLALEEELGLPAQAAPYRAPEAAPGLMPDHRADLFALGRLLEELLATDDGSAAVPTDRLRQLVAACLDEDPTRRPQSAAELLPAIETALRELLREPEPEPEPEAPAERLPPWRRLEGPARWGAVAGGALVLVLAAWWLWPRGDAVAPAEEPVTEQVPDPIDLVVMPFGNSGEPEERALALGFGREVTRLLEGERSISVVASGSAEAAAGLGLTVGELGSRLGVAHVLEGSFGWQRDSEISRAEAVVRLTRVSDGEPLWQETLEAFYGEIIELQDRVATGVARRLGAGGRRGAPPRLTASLGAYEAFLAAVGRTASGDPGELAAAAEGMEQAALLDPGLLLARTHLARIETRRAAGDPATEETERGRRALDAARRISPRHPEVLLAAAELELASGADPAALRDDLEEALGRLPGHPDLLANLAALDRRQGRWEEAVERLVSARDRDPLDVELVGELVHTLAWTRRFDEALAEVDRLAEMLPGSSEPALLRADLLLASRGATAAARAALEGVPEEARERRWQARMLRLELFGGDYGAALARLPELDLEEAEELIERAWLHRHNGDDRRAAASFERARDILDDRLGASPDDPGLSSLLGQAYAGTGGAHLGTRMGQRAVSQLPVTVDAVAGVPLVERLARTYVLAGDRDHALDELAFLLEIPSPVTAAVVRLDPVWRPLRDEPRLQELLERFGP